MRMCIKTTMGGKKIKVAWWSPTSVFLLTHEKLNYVNQSLISYVIAAHQKYSSTDLLIIIMHQTLLFSFNVLASNIGISEVTLDSVSAYIIMLKTGLFKL